MPPGRGSAARKILALHYYSHRRLCVYGGTAAGLQPSRTLCVYGGTAAGVQCLRLSERFSFL